MTTATLTQVQQQVDQLNSEAVTSTPTFPVPTEDKPSTEWIELFQTGELIANLPTHTQETMTQSITTMRR